MSYSLALCADAAGADRAKTSAARNAPKKEESRPGRVTTACIVHSIELRQQGHRPRHRCDETSVWQVAPSCKSQERTVELYDRGERSCKANAGASALRILHQLEQLRR